MICNWTRKHRPTLAAATLTVTVFVWPTGSGREPTAGVFELRVTQVGALAAQQEGGVRVSQAGALAAQQEANVRVSQAGALAAQQEGGVRVTQVGAYLAYTVTDHDDDGDDESPCPELIEPLACAAPARAALGCLGRDRAALGCAAPGTDALACLEATREPLACADGFTPSDLTITRLDTD